MCVCEKGGVWIHVSFIYRPKKQIVIILSNIYNLKFMVCDLKVSQFWFIEQNFTHLYAFMCFFFFFYQKFISHIDSDIIYF